LTSLDRARESLRRVQTSGASLGCTQLSGAECQPTTPIHSPLPLKRYTFDFGTEICVWRLARRIVRMTNPLGCEMEFSAHALAGGAFFASFSRDGASAWHVASGHLLERFGLGGEGEGLRIARLTGAATVLDRSSYEWPTLGLSVTLPIEFAHRTNGKNVEIGLAVRMPVTNGSPNLAVVYATQQAGNSGWREFELSRNFQLLRFAFNVPSVSEGYKNCPIVVVNPDFQGLSRAIELLGLYVKPGLHDQGDF
jgi:hypothetical protein